MKRKSRLQIGNVMAGRVALTAFKMGVVFLVYKRPGLCHGAKKQSTGGLA